MPFLEGVPAFNCLRERLFSLAILRYAFASSVTSVLPLLILSPSTAARFDTVAIERPVLFTAQGTQTLSEESPLFFDDFPLCLAGLGSTF